MSKNKNKKVFLTVAKIWHCQIATSGDNYVKCFCFLMTRRIIMMIWRYNASARCVRKYSAPTTSTEHMWPVTNTNTRYVIVCNNNSDILTKQVDLN